MKKIFIISCLVLGLFGLWQIKLTVFAEGGTGSIPDSGATSRIKAAYDWLVGKGLNYGSTDAPDWDSTTTYPWGTWWNRLMESAAWEPDGTATASSVTTGLTFYAGNGDRTIKTGTRDAPIDYSLQQYSARDDYGGPNGSGAEDYQGEEATWTDKTAGGNTVWKDERTGLSWTGDLGAKLNQFQLSTCAFFDAARKDYDGTDVGVGNLQCGPAADAINYCALLGNSTPYGGYSDWYLPSQKELMQAYIDGMYNKAGTTLADAATFTTTSYFWSSSEKSNDGTGAWYVGLSYGATHDNDKGNSSSVRCVRRD